MDPPLEPDECCVADVIAFRSVTQHSSGSDDDSVEPKWRHFGSSTDSTEPPQRCVSVRRLGFVFSDNQLRQNTHLSVPTTYVASLSARTEREKCGWGRVFEPSSLVPVIMLCWGWAKTPDLSHPARWADRNPTVPLLRSLRRSSVLQELPAPQHCFSEDSEAVAHRPVFITEPGHPAPFELRPHAPHATPESTAWRPTPSPSHPSWPTPAVSRPG